MSGRTAAIYLAHLNPMTRAHEQIISTLLQKGYRVYVFPVRFVKGDGAGEEVNTRSFPFSYELRKAMVDSVFGGGGDNAAGGDRGEGDVTVLPDYAFYAPFAKYLPPLLSSRSWELRNQIISRIKERDFVSYTGDKAERLMLKAYRLHPLKAERLEISASSVKDMLYRQALEGDAAIEGEWRRLVPEKVANLVKKHWGVVDRFARIADATTRVMGMKFPKDGFR